MDHIVRDNRLTEKIQYIGLDSGTPTYISVVLECESKWISGSTSFQSEVPNAPPNFLLTITFVVEWILYVVAIWYTFLKHGITQWKWNKQCYTSQSQHNTEWCQHLYCRVNDTNNIFEHTVSVFLYLQNLIIIFCGNKPLQLKRIDKGIKRDEMPFCCFHQLLKTNKKLCSTLCYVLLINVHLNYLMQPPGAFSQWTNVA